MPYHDLRAFLTDLEQHGELKRLQVPVSPALEMTEICQRTLRADGPALLFEQSRDYTTPVLGNLFGKLQRVMTAMGVTDADGLRDVGRLLGFLREPQWPAGVSEAVRRLPIFSRLLHVSPRLLMHGPVRKKGLRVTTSIFQGCRYRPAGRMMQAR